MTTPPTSQTNPLDPVFSGVPVVFPQTGMVNPTWNKWFVDVRQKLNVINAETATPVIKVHAGTNVTVDNTDPQNPIVSSSGGALPSGGTAGQVLTKIDSTPGNADWQSPGAASWVIIKKSVNEARSSTTTVTSDGALFTYLLASTLYHIRGYLLFFQSDSSMGNKFATNYSGALTSVYYTLSEVVAGNISNSLTYASNANVQISNAGGGGGTGYVSYHFDILLATNTSGTFSVQWAQNSSSVNSLTLLAGSYFEYQPF